MSKRNNNNNDDKQAPTFPMVHAKQCLALVTLMHDSINMHLERSTTEIREMKYIPTQKNLVEALDTYVSAIRKLREFHHVVEQLFPTEQVDE